MQPLCLSCADSKQTDSLAVVQSKQQKAHLRTPAAHLANMKSVIMEMPPALGTELFQQEMWSGSIAKTQKTTFALGVITMEVLVAMHVLVEIIS